MSARACEGAGSQDLPLLTQVLAATDGGVAVFDADHSLVVWNDDYFGLLAYPRKLAKVGTAFADLIRHDVKRGHCSADELGRLLARRAGTAVSAPVPATTVRELPERSLEIRSTPLADGGFVQQCVITEAPAPAPAPTDAGAEADGDLGSGSDDRRFRDFAEASWDWFWETDQKLRFSFMSQQFTEATGIPVDHMIGRTRAEIARESGATADELRGHLADLKAHRPFRDFRYGIVDPATLKVRHLKASGKPIFDDGGRFQGYRGSGTDVTTEVEARQSAERAKRQLADAIESFSEGLALFDAEDRLIFVNQRFRDLYSEIADQIVCGIRFEDLARLKFERGLIADTGEALESRLRWYTELHRNPRDSHEMKLSDGRWLRISDRRTSDGGIVTVRTDITELKRRETALMRLSDELRTQNLRFDTALNNMVQGLCMFDSEQRLIVCNQRYLELYSFSPDVVKPGITLPEIMKYSVSLGNYRHEDAAQAIADRPTHAAKRETSILHQRLNDGRVIAVMHQPMADGGSVATYEDVTQTVRAEESLRDYAAKLERSNRELQDFASVASHDLQEPLRKIEAFGDRLQAKCADDLCDTGKMYIERMQVAACRMRLLINDLLGYSRVTTKARPFVTLDLNQVAEEVISDLQVTIENAEGEVQVENLPTLEADPTQLRQLIQNLISNALKFRRPETNPVVRLIGRDRESIDLGDGAEVCEFAIADNGIGFDQKYADRIFGIFQRLHGRNEYEGTGIGLATCRKIVERHDGKIVATSAPGEGATFTITIPVKRPAGEPAP